MYEQEFARRFRRVEVDVHVEAGRDVDYFFLAIGLAVGRPRHRIDEQQVTRRIEERIVKGGARPESVPVQHSRLASLPLTPRHPVRRAALEVVPEIVAHVGVFRLDQFLYGSQRRWSW